MSMISLLRVLVLLKMKFWVELRKTIELDEVEELSQFLGRGHSITETQCVMDMRDYARESVALYLEIAGKDTVLR